ncbi:hypothetical protein J6Z48_03190 [bacterium]|nr:hypothetical protein [bacterium]
MVLFGALLSERTFAASTISLNPSSGVIPAEGLYVDVIVENALDSGVEFNLNYNGNVTVKDVHESFSATKKYVYGSSPTVIDLPSNNAYKVFAPNLSGSTSTFTTSGVVTTFLITPQSGANGPVTLSFSEIEEEIRLVPTSGSYMYTVGNAGTPVTLSGGNTSNTETPTSTQTVTNATNLPQTFLSSKSLLVLGFVLLIAGELFGQIFNLTRSLFRKTKNN